MARLGLAASLICAAAAVASLGQSEPIEPNAASIGTQLWGTTPLCPDGGMGNCQYLMGEVLAVTFSPITIVAGEPSACTSQYISTPQGGPHLDYTLFISRTVVIDVPEGYHWYRTGGQLGYLGDLMDPHSNGRFLGPTCVAEDGPDYWAVWGSGMFWFEH
jgi:hypothetical protein